MGTRVPASARTREELRALIDGRLDRSNEALGSAAAGDAADRGGGLGSRGRGRLLVAWGIARDGRKVLLHLMAGSREDVETLRAFLQDMRSRGLDDPLLVVTDGAPGIIRAAEECFPRAVRQRGLEHRMCNLVVKVPELA